jgi:hypothetical protein
MVTNAGYVLYVVGRRAATPLIPPCNRGSSDAAVDRIESKFIV